MSFLDKTPEQRLSNRIKARLVALGISEREASRRAGFSPGYVSDVIHGRSREPAMPRMIKLAAALECDVAHLVEDQEAPRTVKDAANQPTSSQRLIDLYASNSPERGPWVAVSGEAVDKVPVIPPLTHVKSAYAFSVSSPSMEPRYYVGEVIYLNPAITPRQGDFVFAKMRSGLGAVARLERITGGLVQLSFLNAPLPEAIRMADLAFIHRIVGSAG